MSRTFISAIVGVTSFGLALAGVPAQADENIGSPELIAAAKAEGKMILYTANFAEVEQDVIKEFNRFSGNQGRDGARAGRPADHPCEDRSRGGQADRRHRRSFRPRTDAATWTRIMFERQVLGEDYWAKQAATHPILYPSGAPMSDALVRGEIGLGPLLYNAVYPKQKDGAPLKVVFPPEGVPANPYATGIPKTAAHPNAAKLYLNWCLSREGQAFMIKEQGNLTSLKVAPVYPEGFDPKVEKVWYPNFDQYVKLHADWVADWDKTFGYRQ